MNPNTQMLLTIAIPTISVWVAALIYNRHLGTLGTELGAIEGDMKRLLKSEAANAVTLSRIEAETAGGGR